MESNCIIIAVDGTAASGKGTLCKMLAAHYHYSYLDTGALYRKAGLALVKEKVSIDDLDRVLNVIKDVDYEEEIDQQILQSEEVGRVASQIGTKQEVRKVLNKIQLNFPLGKKGVIIDGRDIGTQIFPNADIKFFITASIEARAKRRFTQLSAKGLCDNSFTIDAVLADLKERDERDIKRSIAPTVAAPDALIINTSELSIDDVFALVVTLSQKVANLS